MQWLSGGLACIAHVPIYRDVGRGTGCVQGPAASARDMCKAAPGARSAGWTRYPCLSLPRGGHANTHVHGHRRV